MITKKNPEQEIQKDIGKIFTKYNLIEYKPQGDYLGYDDYFYMQGNAHLMKSGGEKEDSIRVEDISVTMVCYGYPRKLINHLLTELNRTITERVPGIYLIGGELFSTQIVVLRRIDKKQYLWLSSLRKKLEEEQQKQLLKSYEKNKENRHYEDVMSFIALINKEEFRKMKDMCKGLMEVVRPEIEIEKKEAIEQAKPGIIEQAKPGIIEQAEPGIVHRTCLEIARELKECLDVEVIASKLKLPVETVRQL